MPVYGAVEIGGTKTDVAFGTSPQDISSPERIVTTTPDETLGAIVGVLGERPVDAIGVASFGPLDLESGSIASTPKPGWSGAPIRATVAAATGAPVSIDLDVTGSALGEGRWGAAAGMANYVYVTIGTGIGAAPVIGGRPLRGQSHPEAGHVVVSRKESDEYPGHCPFHGDCLEGMASGPALEARFGPPGSWLGREEPIVDLTCFYVAQGMRSLVYTVAPERIVIGGGVTSLPGFHRALRTRLDDILSGYPTEPDLDLLISPPGLGELSGLAGALILAADAIS